MPRRSTEPRVPTVATIRAQQSDPICPNADQHTPDQPTSYTGWHHWATRMSRTHNQVRCPGCGLYEIWIPKVARRA